MGAGLVLRRRRRAPMTAAVALAVGVAAPLAGADDVLLLLPPSFDVKPVGGWGRYGGGAVQRLEAKDLAGDPPFRFRGEEVTFERHWVDHHDMGECWVDVEVSREIRATFHRGSFQGRWVQRSINYNRGCKDRDDGAYMRTKDEGPVTGRADADGRLAIIVEVAEGEIVDRKLEWVKRGKDYHLVAYDQWTKRNQAHTPWSYGLEFQLPVGELQSSQKLSPRPTPVPAPGPGARREGRDPARSDATSGGGSSGVDTGNETESSGDTARAKVPRGGSGAGDGQAGIERQVADEGESGDGASEPVSPAEAAGAAAGAAAVSLLGAIWMLVSTGVRPGDLLSPPPALDGELPPGEPPLDSPPAGPSVVHRDGDVNPETGERWSTFDRGWIGADEYARRHGADQAEIARAQQASRDEAERRSAEIAEGLRESEARQREAAAAQGDAARRFELEASQRPETIEPYEPAWSDRVASGLELGEKVADNLVSVLGELTGKAGQVGGRIYTVTKETLKGASEGVAAYARGQEGVFAEKGSAWVIAERAGIGLAKGGAKVGLDMAAGKVMEGVAKLGGRSIPELPDLGNADVVDVVGEVVTGAGEAAVRQAAGIAIGKTAGSQVVQTPVGMAVKAATGEKI